MAHIAHQLSPVCLEGGVSRWLVGVVGLGAELHQHPHAARGALLRFDWRIETRGADQQAVARSAACPRGGQEEKSRCFLQPTKPCLSNVQEENLSCLVHVTRW
jgi:hypothetical protein